MKFQSWQRVSAALLASTLLLVLFLAPGNTSLYELILFPTPDPRTPDIEHELQDIRAQHISVKELAFPSQNGMLLHGLFFERPDTKRLFLLSHGKGNNIYIQVQRARLLLGCGASVFMYDYQGFGRSQGRPTVAGTCDDAIAAYDFLVNHEKRTGNDIIAVGQSWGSGPTGQLAAKRPLGGVIMHAGFSSLCDAARDTLFWLRLYPDWCFPRQFLLDNVAIFSKPHPPLLIIHGKTDQVIPCTEAERLFAAAVEPKTLLLLPRGHSSVGDGVVFASAVRQFMAGTIQLPRQSKGLASRATQVK